MTEGHPIILIDFDGVINQFPDEKVRRRQNSTEWMKPEDPRIDLYAPNHWFIPDRRQTVLAVRPDAHIGISRPQMDCIERFVTCPPDEPSVRFEVAEVDHEGHWGF